jgi:nucleoid-associated protein YgaU
MFRQALTVLCAGLLAAAGGCGKRDLAAAEAEERGSSLCRKAREAEQSGDLKEAIRLYNRVLVEEPKSFSAHFQLATLLHDHAEDYVGAIYHYQQYLYLRPESEKSTLAQERIRIAEQLLAPKILRKVGDSVQGISQAHLLKENDRLNRVITTLEGEKSVLAEQKGQAEQEREALRSDNERLREILSKMRAGETAQPPREPLLKRVESSVKAADEGRAGERPDGKSLRAMRAEAEALSSGAGAGEPARKPLVDVPSTEDVLKKVQSRLTGEQPAAAPPAAPARQEEPKAAEKSEKPTFSALSLLGRDDKKAKPAKAGEQRTYVVQPGDTLFRVSEKFYGDSAHWRRIRDANRARIDPDGRIRAGQIIVVP